LQTLRFLALRSGQGFGVSQSRQSLVALGGEQKPLQIAPKTFALGTSPAEEIVESLSVVFQRARSRIDGQSFGHSGTSWHLLHVATIEARLLPYFNKLPLLISA